MVMKSSRSMSLLLQVAAVLTMWSVSGVSALWLSIPPSGTKCVSEDIQANVVVLADYAVMYEDQSNELATVSAKVTSPFGNTLHQQDNATTGHFAFTTTESGTYVACFWIRTHQKNVGASMNLDWRTGIAAKDWDSVAKKEKLEGVALELMKLEGAVQAIHDNLLYLKKREAEMRQVSDNLLYLKKREAEMRQVSETTNARVVWFSLMALGVCIIASVLQLWHLKTFFQKKKLI